MEDNSELGLEGKVAIVLGGGSRAEGIGNGRAAAILLARAGAKVVVAATIERHGRLDVLDNNIGISSQGSVVEESEEAWKHLMDVNVNAMFLAAKYTVPAMIASGEGGSIINISSISALRPRGLTAYTTSKGAVIALTRAMAVDHGPDGIRVNCVAPVRSTHPWCMATA